MRASFKTALAVTATSLLVATAACGDDSGDNSSDSDNSNGRDAKSMSKEITTLPSDACALLTDAEQQQYIGGPIDVDDSMAAVDDMPYGWSASCTWATEFSSGDSGSIRARFHGYKGLEEGNRSGTEIASSTYDSFQDLNASDVDWRDIEIAKTDEAQLGLRDTSSGGTALLNVRVGNMIVEIEYSSTGVSAEALTTDIQQIATTLLERATAAA